MGFNEKENKFLLRAVDERRGQESKRRGEERPDWMQSAGSKPPSRATGPSMTTARDSTVSAASSQLNGAIDELRGFNSQLMELKGYLRQTNDRLKTLEADGHSTGRTRSTRQTSRSRSSAGFTERTGASDISSVIDDARAA